MGSLRPIGLVSFPGEGYEFGMSTLPPVSGAFQAPLDPGFIPPVLVLNSLRNEAGEKGARTIRIGAEQGDGSFYSHDLVVPLDFDASSGGGALLLERMVKFLLWSVGGWKIVLGGLKKDETASITRRFSDTECGRFDSELIGEMVYDRPILVQSVELPDFPSGNTAVRSIGGHLDGCRIGFDLGASDRKAAAVKDGEVVFSEEIVWDPRPQADPQWHFDQIMDSLKRAAEHLPRVDAIGGSSAGVIVNGEVRIASLFRGVPDDLFKTRVRHIFSEVQQAWNGIPFEIANDGDVTALAGSMAMKRGGVLGIAMGSSEAVGYVAPAGNITTRLNELAFAPVDLNENAAVDEWSGDWGCGVQYFSQQAVGKLIPRAGIEVPGDMPLPEQLKKVQALMSDGDERASRIYETLGVYLGYTLPFYREFYEFDNALILGRVSSGEGGELVINKAKEVLAREFPGFAQSLHFHEPDETEKRHGQAVAAASLPERE